jgi:hypothetical protein
MPKKESSPTDSSPAAASPASLPSARNIRRLDLPLEDIIDIRRKSLDQPQLEGTRRKSLDPPQLEDIVGTRRQSLDQPQLDIVGTRRQSLVPPYLEDVVVDTRRKSRDPSSVEMVDADNLDDDNPSPVSKEFSSLRSLAKSASTSTSSTPTPQTQGPYLTTKDFNYTMTLLDNKINALYKLCRYIGDEQQENSRLISKLVAIDELSDGFWNVSFNIFNFDLISLFNPLK